MEGHIQSELTVAANAGLLTHHFVDGVHKVDRATQTLALRIGQPGIQQRMGYGIECGADREPGVVVGSFGNKVTLCGGVVAAYEILDQLFLLGAKRGVGFCRVPRLRFLNLWTLQTS